MTPVRVVPPDGSSGGLSPDDEEAWTGLVSAQLADVRKSAESWRNGLAGLLGLVSIFAVVRGQSDVNVLDAWAARTTGVLLFLGLVSAAVGALASMQAAYGHPTVLTRMAFRKLGGAEGFRFEKARKAASDLRRARVTTMVALGFIVAAVGVTWYGPRSSANTVQVMKRSGEQVCGQLVQSSDGKIQIDSKIIGIVIIELPQVASLKPAKDCP